MEPIGWLPPYQTDFEYEESGIEHCELCMEEIEEKAGGVPVVIKPYTYKGNRFLSIWHLECWRKEGKADVATRS
jgi:hypothetical protein